MISRTLSIEDICKRLRPIFGKRIDQLYLKYVMTSDRQAKAEIEQALNALYQRHLAESLLNDQVLLEPPRKEIIGGKYPLGQVMYGEKELYPFCLREKDWMRHVCISGMSGSGKTTFAFQILGNFIFNKKPFLVFDWKKSFRPLMKLNDKLRIYTVGNENIANFKLNINKPPRGVEPKEWVNLLADIITEAYSGSFGVHKLLVETLDKAYESFGVYAGSNNYPTWYQIRDRLEERAANQKGKSRESEWLESALRVAYSLTFGNFGKAICYKGAEESDILELFNEEVIMELASLSNTEKKFFTQFMLSYIYKYAKAGNVNTTQEFKYAILVDEAHNIFLKDKPNFISESIADVIFREIREYGVSLITLDQHVSKLSDVVAGNSATNIAFQQMLPADIEAISRLMQLQEKKDYFTKLPVGSGIVRLVERHHDPFIIKAPLIKLKDHDVSDDEMQERMKLLLKNSRRKKVFAQSVQETELAKKINKIEHIFKVTSVEPNREEFAKHIKFEEAQKAAQKAQEEHNKIAKDGPSGFGIQNHLQQKILDESKKRMLNGETPEELKKWYVLAGYNRSDVNHTFNYIERQKIAEKYLEKGKTKAAKPLELNKEELQLLQTAAKHPLMPISQLYKEAGFSPRKGNEIKKQLEDKGIIELEEVKTEKGWTKNVKIYYTDELTKLLSHSHKSQTTEEHTL